jgi:hypothetical protein
MRLTALDETTGDFVSLPLENTPAGRAVLASKTVAFDLHADEFWSADAAASSQRVRGKFNVLCTPLLDETRRVVGVLQVARQSARTSDGDDDPAAFSAVDVAQLEVVGAHASALLDSVALMQSLSSESRAAAAEAEEWKGSAASHRSAAEHTQKLCQLFGALGGTTSYAEVRCFTRLCKCHRPGCCVCIATTIATPPPPPPPPPLPPTPPPPPPPVNTITTTTTTTTTTTIIPRPQRQPHNHHCRVLAVLQLLKLVREALPALLRVEAATLFLVDGSSHEVYTHSRPEALTSLPRNADLGEVAANADVRLAVGSGLVGSAAITGATVTTAEAYDDPRFDPKERLTPRLHTMMCVPVRAASGAVVAVVQLCNKAGAAFTQDDASAMSHVW